MDDRIQTNYSYAKEYVDSMQEIQEIGCFLLELQESSCFVMEFLYPVLPLHDHNWKQRRKSASERQQR